MADVAKGPPRATAPTSNRKPHTKSRTGCYSCKVRRVKCSETRPVCDNCRLRQLDCVYPSQFKSQSPQPNRRLQPNYNGKNYTCAVHYPRPMPPPPPAIRPAAPPQFPPFFTMDDMRFFHHYMLTAYPHLPDGSDIMWITEIPLLAHEHEFLMHAILSLGASHLSLVSMHGSPPEEMRSYLTMLSHRGLALRGLQQSMDKQAQAAPLTVSTMPNITKLNAMLATCYALTTQSYHLRDGFTDFLILIRGCARLTGHITTLTGLDPNSLPISLKEGFDPRTHFKPLTGNGGCEGLNADPSNPIDIGIKMCNVKLLAESLRLLIPLLQHECHRNYHAAILEAAEALQRRAWIDAFNLFQKSYVILCAIDDVSFQNYILPPPRTGAGAETGAEMEKNGMFLLLFIHLTALKVAMYPMLWRVMPERARFPQAIFPQASWLIEISARISPLLHGYAVLPLEVVVRVGDEYGMFKSEPGERMREELIARAEGMRWAGLYDGKYMDMPL